MLIFLTGYMGSGKTTYGKMFSEKYSIPFVDMDNYIEEEQNCRISDIFAQKGEAAFREIEHNTLKQLTQKHQHLLISTGGGTPCFFDNMEIINKTGFSIYLKWQPIELVNNLYEFCADRPLLKNKTREELIEFITETLQKREPFYTKAHFTYHPATEKVEILENKILEHIKKQSK